ncbi:MAG: OadG family protein [Victivallales bacterium]|jgi:sodium pump decarboxylase gamma subunit|nr:OadG family protein [Victivallales bacterium]
MEQIMSGLILLVAGMGMTFLFLIVQILCTNFFSSISGKFAGLVPEPEVKKPVKKAAAPAPKQDDLELVAAIAAAIHHANR